MVDKDYYMRHWKRCAETAEESLERAIRHSLTVRFQMVQNHRAYGSEIEKLKPVEISYDEFKWLLCQIDKLEQSLHISGDNKPCMTTQN